MEDIKSYVVPILKQMDTITFERMFSNFRNVKNIYEKVIPLLEEIDIDDIYMLLRMRDITLEKLYTNLLPVLKRVRQNDERCGEDRKKTTRFILTELIQSRMTIEQAIQYVDVFCNKKRKCDTIIEIPNKK